MAGVRCSRLKITPPGARRLRGQTAIIREGDVQILTYPGGPRTLTGALAHPSTKVWTIDTAEGVWKIEGCGCAGACVTLP